MIKKLATIGATIALLATSAMPVFAGPPGPPDLADPGCPGRSVNAPGTGPQATPPDLATLADCPLPTVTP